MNEANFWLKLYLVEVTLGLLKKSKFVSPKASGKSPYNPQWLHSMSCQRYEALTRAVIKQFVHLNSTQTRPKWKQQIGLTKHAFNAKNVIYHGMAAIRLQWGALFKNCAIFLQLRHSCVIITMTSESNLKGPSGHRQSFEGRENE